MMYIAADTDCTQYLLYPPLDSEHKQLCRTPAYNNVCMHDDYSTPEGVRQLVVNGRQPFAYHYEIVS